MQCTRIYLTSQQVVHGISKPKLCHDAEENPAKQLSTLKLGPVNNNYFIDLL